MAVSSERDTGVIRGQSFTLVMAVSSERDTGVIRGQSFTSGFDIDEITQKGWIRFKAEIMSKGSDLVM